MPQGKASAFAGWVGNGWSKLTSKGQNALPATTSALAQSSPSPNQSGTGQPQAQDTTGAINLVNYTPEQLVQHVDQQIDRVEFGWSFNTKVMENFSEGWALIGPAILVLGTIGEVFLVLWLRQKEQNVIAGLSIVAVALVMEGTFLAISYKAATIRNRGERRSGGASALDRLKLKRQFRFWFALAAGVCATQIIFVAAQTNDAGIGVWGVWIFAILRAAFTLVADGYTAFAHEEKPTTAERAQEEQEQRTKHADILLAQKQREITTINDGILRVREAHTEAQIKDDKLKTRLQVEIMQNKTQVDTLRTQQEQATMFITLQNNMMRAIFDPKMPEEDRKKLLGTLQGFMSTAKLLKPPGQTTVTEEGE